jgi:hypothetical protein
MFQPYGHNHIVMRIPAAKGLHSIVNNTYLPPCLENRGWKVHFFIRFYFAIIDLGFCEFNMSIKTVKCVIAKAAFLFYIYHSKSESYIFKSCSVNLGTFAWIAQAPISYVMSVRPSVCKSLLIYLPFRKYQRGFQGTDFREILTSWSYTTAFREHLNLVKIWQNFGHVTWRPKYVYTVDRNAKYFVSQQECKRIPLLHFHGNTRSYCWQIRADQQNYKGKYLLRFHSKNDYANTPHFYVRSTFPIFSIVLFYFTLMYYLHK